MGTPRVVRTGDRDEPQNVWPLQAFSLDEREDHAPLCFHRVGGSVAFINGALRLDRSSVVSFDRYLNVFYEGFWRRHTHVRDVAVKLTGSGRVVCRISRWDGDRCSTAGEVELILDSVRPALVPIDDAQDLTNGARLSLELEAVELSVIHGCTWVTNDHPLHDVKLGVGACTFEREPFIAATAQVLLSAPLEAAVERLVIVNQGRPFVSRKIAELQADEPERLTVIEQPNFGGAGGFTRAAMELADKGDVTHVLFMDDDIRLDPIHLATAAAFLRYSNRPIVVGGQMLDLIEPTMMFEAGAVVTPDNQLLACHRDLDLTRQASLSALSEVLEPDFNGWWFSIIPAHCFSQHGLPLPIFIRGDDQEYGVRLREAGVATVSLPPVSVWHQPFYTRPPGWQLYYDLRNRLIFASMHPGRFSLDRPIQLMKRLWAAILRYDYQLTETMILAIGDFLKGPDLLQVSEPDIHRRVQAELARCAPLRLDCRPPAEMSQEKAPSSRSAQRVRLLTGFLWAVVGRPPGGTQEKLFLPEMPLEFMRLGASYIFGGPRCGFFLRYTYSRHATWRQLRRTLGVIALYARRRRRTAEAWRRAQPQIVSRDAWNTRLGLTPT